MQEEGGWGGGVGGWGGGEGRARQYYQTDFKKQTSKTKQRGLERAFLEGRLGQAFVADEVAQ